MTPAPDNECLSLKADPVAASLILYRKIVHGETFGRHTLKPAELRWLFCGAQQACQTGSTFMSWPVMETLLGITFDALVYAAENDIPVNTCSINQTFNFTGWNYREEASRYMSGMRRSVDTTRAESLLRPLSSGALNLEAFPDGLNARICTAGRLKVIFPLVVRSLNLSPEELKAWASATGLVINDFSKTSVASGISLRMEIWGNRFPQQPGTPWHAPSFNLFVIVGRVSLAFGWDVFSALIRYMRARAWQGATFELRARDRLVSLYIMHGEVNRVVLGLNGTQVSMTLEEYLGRETAFLEAVEAPDMAPVLAELRVLYGDL